MSHAIPKSPGQAMPKAPLVEQAQASASTYQGKPCRAGHDGQRYRANRACVDCSKAARLASYDKAASAKVKAKYRARLKAQALGAALLEGV